MTDPGFGEAAHPLMRDLRSDIDFIVRIPDEFWNAYYLELGHLMHQFAKAENALAAMLLQKAHALLEPSQPQLGRVNPLEVMGALLAGMRVSPMKDTLKRLLRIAKASDETTREIDAVFLQFSEIQFLRDRLAHNAATPLMTNKAGYLSVVNHSSREPTTDEVIYFKIETLADASADLYEVITRLGCALNPGMPARADPAPWRYRPASLIRGGQKHRKNREES